MPIEATENGGVIITGNDIIDVWRPLQLKSAIKLEVNTGLINSRGSVMNLINREYGQHFRRKKDALAFMEELCEKIKEARNGDTNPPGSPA